MALLFILCSFGVSFPLSFFFTFSYYYVRLRAFFSDTCINWVLKKKYTQAHKIRKRCTQARHQKKNNNNDKKKSLCVKDLSCERVVRVYVLYVYFHPSINIAKRQELMEVWPIFSVFDLCSILSLCRYTPSKHFSLPHQSEYVHDVWYIKWAAIIIRNTESTLPQVWFQFSWYYAI